MVVRSAQEAAALRCTASSAGLSVATPVGRHGVVVHYVPRVEGALEDVVRAVEARAGEGEGVGVVRGRPRWLGRRSAALGSVLVLLWDPVLAEALCSGDGELMVACMRARCERARPGREREREREKSIFKSPEAFYRPMLTGQLPTAQGEGGGGCEGGRGVLEMLRMSERGQETREMSTTTEVEV